MDRPGTILIADDFRCNRAVFAKIFSEEYRVFETANSIEAICTILSQNNVSAILLALTSNKTNFVDTLRFLHEKGITKSIPVFLTTDSSVSEIPEESYHMGVADIIVMPFSASFLKYRIRNFIELYNYRHKLEDTICEQDNHLHELMHGMLVVLATAIEFRDCESGEHVRRICNYTKKLLQKLCEMYPEYSLSEDEIDKISSSALLHDVGKISIPDSILNKPGALTKEEFEVIKLHTLRGSELLQRVPDMLEKDVYRYTYDICKYHHERYDGSGYPEGLVGDDIPIWAQVVGVADAYDALTSVRAYKGKYDHRTAVNMILNNECGIFNPKILSAFETLTATEDFSETV